MEGGERAESKREDRQEGKKTHDHREYSDTECILLPTKTKELGERSSDVENGAVRREARRSISAECREEKRRAHETGVVPLLVSKRES